MPWVCTCGQSNIDEEYPCSTCNRFVDDEPDAVVAPVGRRFKSVAPAHVSTPALFDQEEDEVAPVGRRFKTAAASASPASVVMPATPKVDPEAEAQVLADRRALVARLAEEGRAEEARKKEAARKALLARLTAEAEANERARAENARLHQERADRERAEQARAEQARAEQARAEQARAEQARAEQARAEQARAEQARAEQARAEQARAEQARAEQARAEQERAEQARAEQARAEQERAEQERAEQERAEQERAEQERAEQERAEQERAEQERAEQARAEEEKAARLAEERKATAHRLAEQSSVAHPDSNLDWLEDDAWFSQDEEDNSDPVEAEESFDNRARFFERLAANADSVHVEPESMIEELDREKLSQAWNEQEADHEEESAFDWFATATPEQAIEEEQTDTYKESASDPIDDVVDPYGLQFADWSATEEHEPQENHYASGSQPGQDPVSTNWWEEEDDDDEPPVGPAATKGHVSPKPAAWNDFDEDVDLDAPDDSEIERKRIKAKSVGKNKRPAPRTLQPVKVHAPFFAGLLQQHSRVVIIAALVVVIGLLGTLINGVFNRASAEGELASATTCADGGSASAHDEDDFAALFGSNVEGLDAIPDYSSNGGPIDFSQALQREPDLGGALALLESTRFLGGFSRTFEGSGNTMAATVYEFANSVCADDYLKAQVLPGPAFAVPFGVSSVGYSEVQGDTTIYVVRTVQNNTLLSTAFIGGNAETGPQSSIDVALAIAERMSGGKDSGVIA